ncbi:hypothetical protein EI983_08145 [Roseovarius faecimaris]|uniref:Immunity MXAN-0049 protein domain-containing protein n=1 Tax=Roseovarius faecimaris TaxID=2494550 RepID=A0A6I6IQ44_9RHOB|nr:hypothetical protein [Roseovarius faecimaris]QGX98254.1 hypothetical protein EI983_08145 [Roseovarius faecimaris]
MAGKKPKVWVTRGFHSTETRGWWLDLETWAEEPREYVEIQNHYNQKELMPDKYWPTGLFVKYKKGQGTVIKAIKDVCVTRLGIIVISKRFYDLLQQFNLGQTAFRAMPVYGYDRTTRFPEDYYMMQMLEFRSFAQPEEMENVRPSGGEYYYWLPDKPAHKPVLHIPGDHDLDLWMDTEIWNWVFVSDRLKEAIKSEGIKGGGLGFRPCKLVDR